MLLTKDLIQNVEDKYKDMLRTVNIPDFTKCIAVFSGLSIEEIDDNMIKEYLITWAEHKYRFYQMLGNKTRIDNPFVYRKLRESIAEEIKQLSHDYPAYAPWLEDFRRHRSNKMEVDSMSYSARDRIRELFPELKINGTSITHFFKRRLNAPDDLITGIGRIFEHDEVEATHTISIDPIDIMLASENPYDWDSCYRLETDNRSSHADGCMAALLDCTSIITYVWNREGKYSLYNEYELKNIRYKRMRQWVAVSEKFTTLHFNTIYPGKDDYGKDFEKDMRIIVETHICNYLNIRNMWKACERGRNTSREIDYGYNEFRYYYMFHQSDSEPEDIVVYDTAYHCACGCGEEIQGADSGEDYLGEGFHHSCFEDRYYCEYIEDYCDCDGSDENCADCTYWQENHPVCSLDETEMCEDIDWDYANDGVMRATHHHCSCCPNWIRCHSNDDEEDENEDEGEDESLD